MIESLILIILYIEWLDSNDVYKSYQNVYSKIFYLFLSIHIVI